MNSSEELGRIMRRRFKTDPFPAVIKMREDERVEFKAAQGKHGRGEIPRALWESYVAFANTRGGVIILGVEERGEDALELVGVKEAERLVDELWVGVNDPLIVSANILTKRDIFIVEQGGVKLVVMRVPSAPAEQRPLYLGNDPNTGSYVRLSESDVRVEPEVAKFAFHVARNLSLRDGLSALLEIITDDDDDDHHDDEEE